MWPLDSANTDSVWASTSKSRPVSRRHHGSVTNAGCPIMSHPAVGRDPRRGGVTKASIPGILPHVRAALDATTTGTSRTRACRWMAASRTEQHWPGRPLEQIGERDARVGEIVGVGRVW